jgi:hypothetical protein
LVGVEVQARDVRATTKARYAGRYKERCPLDGWAMRFMGILSVLM